MTKGADRATRRRKGPVIEIGIGGLDDAARRFAEVWRAAERGVPPPSRERLAFGDLSTLLGALTPRRWALLRDLRRLGPSSVRALAQAQGRDYKTVHTDVRRLEQIGLIVRGVDGRISVPWTRVSADFDLAA